MADRQFTPDLTGPDESLEALLARLRAFHIHPPELKRARRYTTRRRPGGSGAAEAPIPVETSLPDLCAPG